MKPGKVNEILARVDFHKMARWFWDRHRGYPFRVKTRDICVVFLNHLDWKHGDFYDRAAREAIAVLRRNGIPIASDDDADGGYYWCATEEEKKLAVEAMEYRISSYAKAIQHMKDASLGFKLPKTLYQQDMFNADT